MGMFDDIEVDPAIELPDGEPPKRNFQSKDLECELLKYCITADGRLVQKRRRDDNEIRDHDEEFHGVLNFYTSKGDRMNGDWEWFEYNAKFTDGKLVSIERDLRRRD